MKGNSLAFYQREVLNNWTKYSRQAVRGPRGMGKTFIAAISVLHFALTHDGLDWKVITTASTWAQLENYLWPEIHKCARLLRWDKIGRDPFNDRYELQNTKLKLKTGLAVAVSPEKEEAIEGGHADHMFFVYDEAKIIPPPLWDSVEGTFSNVSSQEAFGISGISEVGGISESGTCGISESAEVSDDRQTAHVFAISTPGEPKGRFWEIHAHRPGFEDWHTIHITKDDAIRAGRMSEEWAEQRKRQWASNPQLYYNHVLGEFHESDEDVLIPLAWVELAFERWDTRQRELALGLDQGDLTSVGADVGSGGSSGDPCTMAYVYDDVYVDKIDRFGANSKENATMEMAGRIKGVIDSTGTHVFLDVIGIGTGTYQRLKEMEIGGKVLPFVASAKVPIKMNKDKTGQFRFANLRAAMWWIGREMLNPEDGENVALPRSDDLLGELTTPHFEIRSNATIFVESKQDIRKRLKRSTDLADAVLQGLVGPRLIVRNMAKVYVPGRGYIN